MEHGPQGAYINCAWGPWNRDHMRSRKGGHAMLSIYQAHAVSESLLREVAQTRWMVDPILFCHAFCAVLVLVVVTVAYFLLAWRGRHSKRQVRMRPSGRAVIRSRPRLAS